MPHHHDSVGDDAPRFLMHLRLRQDPAAGAFSPLLGANDDDEAPRRGHHLTWSLFADRRNRRRDFSLDGNRPRRLRHPVGASARRPPQPVPDRQQRAVRTGHRLGRPHGLPPARQPRPERAARPQAVPDVQARHCHKRPAGIPQGGTRPRPQRGHARTRLLLLQTQGRRGFAEPGDVAIHGYRRHQIERPGRRSRKRADKPRYATLDFEGVLTVTNRSQLLRAIATGFGSSRTWGCGLMLIDPAPTAAATAA